MKTTDIARICHEANRALCAANNDNSQKPWDECEQWQRDSAVKGVVYAIANPNATPEDQHKAWCKDKLENGWVYGPQKNPDHKTHPCLVEYSELPEFQRAKDHLFQSVVRGLIPLLK